jgi:endonuclease/exonuclease/phosphatase (EEP) superfamily protein YafD
MTIGYAFMVFSIIPLIPSSYWFVRIFDYPRSQKFWVTVGVMVAFPFLADFQLLHHKIFLVLLFLNSAYLLTQIWSYTPLAREQMKKADDSSETKLRLFIANVFQDNREFSLCSDAIKECDPDIVLLVETDERWLQEVDGCMKSYPYRVLQPQDNTYGMVLFSRFEILQHSVRFLVEKDIPSITCDVKINDSDVFRLYCLHPKPPVPNESEESTERDAEILMVGKEAKKCKLPVIVAGDLNDVAWSATTNLFLKVSGLLDPRIGRGFFSTFHAAYRLFRWPLDHVFCSTHFCLVSLRRLQSIGSDHFPIFIEVALMPTEDPENVNEKKEADASDLELAEEKIDEAKN